MSIDINFLNTKHKMITEML